MEYQYLMAAARALGNTLISFSIIYQILRKLLNLQLKHSRKVIWFLFAWFLASIPYFFSYNPFIASRPTLVMIAPLYISIFVLLVARSVDARSDAFLYKLLLPMPIFFFSIFATLSNKSVISSEERGEKRVAIRENKGDNVESPNGLSRAFQRESLISDPYLFSFRKNEKWGFHNQYGEIIIAPQFDKLNEGFFAWNTDTESDGHGVIGVFIDGKWGFINPYGEMVITPLYDKVRWFKNGIAAVNRGAQFHFFASDPSNSLKGGPFYWWEGGKWGFIDINGKEIVECQFDNAWEFSNEGLAPVEISERWGLIDRTGDLIVNPTYQFGFALNFSDGLTTVQTVSNKWGFMDRSGQVVIAPRYYNVTKLKNGLAAVYIGERDAYGIVPDKRKWKFIDKTGKLAFNLHVDDTNGFSENLAGVEVDGKWGVIDQSGRFIINPRFDRIDSFHEGLAPANMGGKKSEYHVPRVNPFEKYSPKRQRLGGIFKGGQWGFIDRTGNMVIEPQFDEVTSFSDGLAAVRIGERWGFIDQKGHFAIKPLIDMRTLGIPPRKIGESEWLWVKYNKVYIDEKGHFVIKPLIDLPPPNIPPNKFGKAEWISVKYNYSMEPASISPPKFGKAGWIWVNYNGRWGWIDRSGKRMKFPD
jgi:hypothetical protein